MKASTTTVRIGSRGSQLALWQAHWVENALKERFPFLTIEIVIIKTQGDKITDIPLSKVGGKGLFVKEIEQALMDGTVDIAVHSMKDMPAVIPDSLWICAIPERENPFDIIVSASHLKLEEMPYGARIGTSSLRRASQLLHHRRDFLIEPLRGNIDTRLKKLETDYLDAIVLAAAGMRRLGLGCRISQEISPEIMLPAVGQGALCLETRKNDDTVNQWVSTLNHPDTATVVTGERSFLHRIEGGCQIPVAAHGTLDDQGLVLTGLVADIDGSIVIRRSVSGRPDDAVQLGIHLANRLLEEGALPILKKLKEYANRQL